MSVRVMIIDAHADFRTLLMHHVTTHWPEAEITAFDPVAAGSLPDEFSGAGHDIILLGNALGERDGLRTLSRFAKTTSFRPSYSSAARATGLRLRNREPPRFFPEPPYVTMLSWSG